MVQYYTLDRTTYLQIYNSTVRNFVPIGGGGGTLTAHLKSLRYRLSIFLSAM